MKVSSKNYSDAVARRTEIEDLLDKAYGIAFHLQDMYNEINDNIEDFERSENGLDD